MTGNLAKVSIVIVISFAVAFINDIHFGNGIIVIDEGNTLLVSEHNANRILSFDIADDGSLSDRRLFVRMTDLLPGPAQPSIWLGPDGMKVDSQGNIFVAHYMGGRVVKMSSEGEFLQSFEIPGIAVTNLTFYPDDKVNVIRDFRAFRRRGQTNCRRCVFSRARRCGFC